MMFKLIYHSVIVDESGSELRNLARVQVLVEGIEMTGDQIVDDRVSQKLR